MEIAKINHADTNINGSCLQEYVDTTYELLIKRLGEPLKSYCDKTTCSWQIEFIDNSIATIYDWKTDSTPKESCNWHIGGHSPLCIEKVYDLLQIPKDTA